MTVADLVRLAEIQEQKIGLFFGNIADGGVGELVVGLFLLVQVQAQGGVQVVRTGEVAQLLP